MNQNERLNDSQETMRQAIKAQILDVMTCLPVQVVSFDPATMTCDVQPVQPTRVQLSTPTLNPDGTQNLYTWVNPSVMIRCPVVFFSGGGFTITAPPKAKQDALAIISQRSIDEWFIGGSDNVLQVKQRASMRHHSASDGFILCGVRSLQDVIANINLNAMEIRSDDGTTVISIADNGSITIKAPGGVTVIGSETVIGVMHAASLATGQIPTASVTASSASIPIVLNGVTWYIRLSATP